jgi:hypothetical protein
MGAEPARLVPCLASTYLRATCATWIFLTRGMTRLGSMAVVGESLTSARAEACALRRSEHDVARRPPD